jgi:hypothetical protein
MTLPGPLSQIRAPIVVSRLLEILHLLLLHVSRVPALAWRDDRRRLGRVWPRRKVACGSRDGMRIGRLRFGQGVGLGCLWVQDGRQVVGVIPLVHRGWRPRVFRPYVWGVDVRWAKRMLRVRRIGGEMRRRRHTVFPPRRDTHVGLGRKREWLGVVVVFHRRDGTVRYLRGREDVQARSRDGRVFGTLLRVIDVRGREQRAGSVLLVAGRIVQCGVWTLASGRLGRDGGR